MRLVLSLLTLLLSLSAQAKMADEPLLDRKTYMSPSGTWSLTVDPSDRYGGATGDYELRRAGELVWRKQFAYTLRELRISERGEVAGYAYTKGLGGFGDGGTVENSGDLVVAVFSVDGSIRLERRFRRLMSLILHSDPTPTVADFLIDFSSSRLLVLVETDPTVELSQTSKSWRGWNIESGEEIPVLARLVESTRKSMIAAKQTRTLLSKSTELTRVPAPIKRGRLEEIRQVSLTGSTTAALPAFHINRFQFDEQGRIGFLQAGNCCEKAPPRFWIANPEDGSFRYFDLPKPARANKSPEHALYLGESQWLLLSPQAEGGKNHYRSRLDVATGRITQLGKFSGALPRVDGMASYPRRGFAYYAEDDKRVHCLKPDGGLKGISPRIEYGIQSLMMRADGSVDVLEGVAARIHRLAPDCSKVQTLTLETAMDRKLNYVSDLAEDAEGGWLLHDFHGSPSVYRLNADALVRGTLFPHFADGRKIERSDAIQRAPDGRIWTTDDSALLRLDDKGMVDKVLGPDIGEPALTLPKRFDVLPDGGYLVADQRNGSVHRLDSFGRLVKIFRPEPGDLPANVDLEFVLRMLDGQVVLATGISDTKTIVFNPDGVRTKVQKHAYDELLMVGESAQAGTQLALNLGGAELRDKDGRRAAKISRRADGAWLGYIDGGAMAPDGSFAILSSRSDEGVLHGRVLRPDPKAALTFYDVSGLPVRTVQLGAQQYSRLAFDGGRAYLLDGNVLKIVGKGDGVVTSYELSSAGKDAWWEIDIHPETGTLHALDGQGRVIRVFKLPAT